MEVEADLELADFQALQGMLSKRAGLRLSPRDFVWILVAAIVFVIASRSYDFEVHYPSALGAVAMVGILTAVLLVRARSTLAPEADGVVLGHHRYRVDASGLVDSAQLYETRYQPLALRSLEETADHLFVFVDRCAALVLPKRAFANDEELEAFTVELQSHLG